MSLVAVIAWVMFALLIGWTGAVLYATLRQLADERREAVRREG